MRNSLVVAIILFVVYGLFLSLAPLPATPKKLQSIWQSNLLVIEKYFRPANPPEVVFVGSSLTQQLVFNEASPCVYNLALGGDSSLTGLSVLERSGHKPKLAFVEINVPERGVNQALIEKAFGVLPKLSPIFHIENEPVNLVYNYLLQLKKENARAEVNEAVRQNAISLQRQGVDQLQNPDDLARSMAEFKSVIEHMEGSGTKIIFFELPIYPEFEETPRAKQIRTAFKQTFPKNKFVGFDELSKGLTIRTVDGVHLSPDEGGEVGTVLGRYYRAACTV